jgi:hypothetical protein
LTQVAIRMAPDPRNLISVGRSAVETWKLYSNGNRASRIWAPPVATLSTKRLTTVARAGPRPQSTYAADTYRWLPRGSNEQPASYFPTQAHIPNSSEPRARSRYRPAYYLRWYPRDHERLGLERQPRFVTQASTVARGIPATAHKLRGNAAQSAPPDLASQAVSTYSPRQDVRSTVGHTLPSPIGAGIAPTAPSGPLPRGAAPGIAWRTKHPWVPTSGAVHANPVNRTLSSSSDMRLSAIHALNEDSSRYGSTQAAPSERQALVQGEIILDGSDLIAWITRQLADAMVTAPYGSAGPDGRVTPPTSGAALFL